MVTHVFGKVPLSVNNNSRAIQMDDSATLDVIDGQYNEYASDSEEDQAEMWGRCFPIGKGFYPQGDF